MLSCTEFIPAYSELFRYLDEKGGHGAVVEYWEAIAKNAIAALGDHVKKEGIRGCFSYWKVTLNEEAADFVLKLDEENQEFTIDMRHCPSKGRLLELKQLTPYYDYCGHCDLIYRRVLEDLGYNYEYDLSRVDRAQCALRVTKKKARSV